MYPSDVVFEPLLSQMLSQGQITWTPREVSGHSQFYSMPRTGLAPKGGKQYPKGPIGQETGCYFLSTAMAFLMQPMPSLCPGDLMLIASGYSPGRMPSGRER